nr:MAG: DNA pilot protein [Microvirus sp.]
MGLGALIGVSAAGSVLGAGASVAGNVMNKNSVNRANETNMQIAQMNNEWSEKMAEKQMKYNSEMNDKQFGQAKELQSIQNQFQTDMWNKTNEYNSASAQRERLEQAGLNPYLMMSGGSAGSATAMNGSSASAPSVGSAGLPSPSQVSAQAPQYDFSGVGSSLLAGLDMYNKLKLGSEQADNLGMDKSLKQVELQYKSRQIMQDLANKYAEEKNTQARTKTLNQLRELEKGQMVASTNYTIQQTENLKETMKGVVIQNCMDYLTLKNMPTEIALKNANLAASTAFMVSQRALSEKQAINEIKKGLILDSQASKEKISADYAERMANNLYLQAQSTLRKMLNTEKPTVFQNFGDTFGNDISNWYKNLW